MKVKFRDNVGSVDCRKFGLNFQDCVRDAELEVDDAIAEKLADRNLAEIIGKPSRSKGGNRVEAVPKVETAENPAEVQASGKK